LPASTAESTLNLRSFEYGFMPGDYHVWIDTYGCRCKSAIHMVVTVQRGSRAAQSSTFLN
jgi:hypothetical protein